MALTAESIERLEAALTPQLADSVDDIVGVWMRGPTPFTSPLSIYSQYRADGTVRTALRPDGFDDAAQNQGEFWFEDTNYYVKDIAGITPWNVCTLSAETQIGIYEVLMLPDGRLRWVVVEDACTDRANTATTADWSPVP